MTKQQCADCAKTVADAPTLSRLDKAAEDTPNNRQVVVEVHELPLERTLDGKGALLAAEAAGRSSDNPERDARI